MGKPVAVLTTWAQPNLQRQSWGADQLEVTQVVEEWEQEDVVEVFEAAVLLPRVEGIHRLNMVSWSSPTYRGRFVRTTVAKHRDGRLGVRPSVVGDWEACRNPTPYGMR